MKTGGQGGKRSVVRQGKIDTVTERQREAKERREEGTGEEREREEDRDGRPRQGICSRHGYLLGGYIVYILGTHFIRGSARDTLCRV